MEPGSLNQMSVKKESLTPKAIIHQKYGTTAQYKVEEVLEPSENVCPGLAIHQQVKCLYKCHLELPDFSVTSDTFTRKKEAEQSAAKLAVEKLGIQSSKTSLTLKDVWDELVNRISSVFNNEFLSSSHPLTNHFRVALQREEKLGFIPLPIVSACDSKINNLCKSIDPKSELDPLLMMKLVAEAAKSVPSVQVRDGGLWIGRQSQYPEEFIEPLVNRVMDSDIPVTLEAVRIPCSIESPVEAVVIDISSDHYYLDEISSLLGVKDSSRVLLSRSIGRSSSEMRLYYSPLECLSADISMVIRMHSDEYDFSGLPVNKWASYLSGQAVYGDAVLATVGYKWNQPSLFFEHVSLSTYYRMLLSKIPSENYKISREAMLAAQLPTKYTTRTNWRGSSPKEILSMFCRLHRLSEPVLTIEVIDTSESMYTNTESHKRMKHSELTESTATGNGKGSETKPNQLSCFTCGVKILSKKNDLLVEFISQNTYKKQTDAIQNATLKVISWLSEYFKQLDMPVEKLQDFARAHCIQINLKPFINEFSLSHSVHGVNLEKNVTEKCHLIPQTVQQCGKHENGVDVYKIEGPDNANSPSQGSLACISYSVSLITEGENSKRVLESQDTFEFEIGSGCVINELETCVSQMSVNQTASFVLPVPSRELILAVAGDAANCLSQVSLHECLLEYTIKLLETTEPLEERIEQALFSPPLSKQRVEFAVKYINDSHATNLVDFGCGSGSLLDSLLNHNTSLEKIVGVDISQKGLCRAAKILHARLATANSTGVKVRSAELFDGSITDFDSRLYGFTIGTCLEVIEHMEEPQAKLFGDIALGHFRPSLLIVSTPNYEYNSILQGSLLSTKEEDPEEKGASATNCRFRNHDHKFEWTRQQFQCWATELASRHGYNVEFSGVGGSGDVEPGFASQIAVFSQTGPLPASEDVEYSEPYKTIWKWEA